MMKYDPKIVISTCLVLSLLFAGGLIFYIQRNNGSILGIIMVIYFVIYFNTLLSLYITNTWIFEKYEHDPEPDKEGVFARPQGVHTFPLENLCDYTTSGNITTSVTCPKVDGSKDTITTPTDSNSFLTWLKDKRISQCPEEFQYKGTDTNALKCMNSKKEVICWNGTVASDLSKNPSGSCPPKPPTSTTPQTSSSTARNQKRY